MQSCSYAGGRVLRWGSNVAARLERCPLTDAALSQTLPSHRLCPLTDAALSQTLLSHRFCPFRALSQTLSSHALPSQTMPSQTLPSHRRCHLTALSWHRHIHCPLTAQAQTKPSQQMGSHIIDLESYGLFITPSISAFKFFTQCFPWSEAHK